MCSRWIASLFSRGRAPRTQLVLFPGAHTLHLIQNLAHVHYTIMITQYPGFCFSFNHQFTSCFDGERIILCQNGWFWYIHYWWSFVTNSFTTSWWCQGVSCANCGSFWWQFSSLGTEGFQINSRTKKIFWPSQCARMRQSSTEELLRQYQKENFLGSESVQWVGDTEKCNQWIWEDQQTSSEAGYSWTDQNSKLLFDGGTECQRSEISQRDIVWNVADYSNTLPHQWQVLQVHDGPPVHSSQEHTGQCDESKEGLIRPKNSAQPIPEGAEEKIWEQGILGNSSPETLLNTMVYLFGMHFALRAVQEHKNIKVGTGQIQICVDNDLNLKYLLYTECSSKNNQCGINNMNIRPKQVRAYQNVHDPSRCIVNLYKEYMNRRPMFDPKCSSDFYLRPIANPKSTVWFTCQPIGINLLGKIVKKLQNTWVFMGEFLTILLEQQHVQDCMHKV